MKLDSSKASGADCIPVVVLKNCESELSYILADLFSMCLKECCFPDCWGVSSVVPVFTGDILGYLRVRISDPRERNAPREVFEVFGLETSKKGHSRRGSALFLKSMCPSTSQNYPFIFQKCPFLSWNNPLAFQKCLFISQKCPIVSQYCPLICPKLLVFLMTLKPLNGVLFFMIFTQVLASMIAWKMMFLSI